jgi:hypothetical protein
MTATVTRGSPAAGTTTTGPGGPARGAARRRRLGFPRASTTPGKVRLIRAALVAACLAWGALAALMVNQHASAAGEAAATSEPLSLAAQQIGNGQGSAGTLFTRLEADLDAAIRADQAVFTGSAEAGSGAFTGLVAGIAVLALVMAAGSARGLSRRLAEYR